jgi:large repetitive protein
MCIARKLIGSLLSMLVAGVAYSQVVAVPDTFFTSTNTLLNANAALNDTIAEGETVEYILITTPGEGIVTLNTDGTFEYAPPTNFAGQTTFEYSVCNTMSQCDVATVTINVGEINEAPLVVNENFDAVEETPLEGNVSLNDSDPEMAELHYLILDNPQHGSLVFSSNGDFVYTPGYNYYGVDQFNYWCCDAWVQGNCTAGSVTINVQNVNDAPYVYNGSHTICQGETFSGDIVAPLIDGDGDPITLTAAGCDNGTVNFLPTGEITFTPDADYAGNAIIEFTVCDNQAVPACATFDKLVIVRANTFGILSQVINPASCAGRNNGSIHFSLTGGIGYNSVTWSNGVVQNNVTQWVSQAGLYAGTYNVTVHNIGGCAADSTFQFEVSNNITEPPVLLSEITNEDCLNKTATLSLSGSGAGGPPYTFQWLTQPNAIEQTVQQGVYPIIIRDAMGCIDTVSVEVSVPNCPFEMVKIPEGFSPDGDGINDYFEMPGIEQFPDNSLVVFNAWGTQVFDSVGYRSTWDGKDRPSGELLPEGTYYYVLKVNGQQDVKGSVIIKYANR